MFFLNSNASVQDTKSEIAQLIKKMRRLQGITQDELAAKLNLSRATIQNVEAAKNFTIDTLLLILQYFEQLQSFQGFIKEKSEEFDNLDSLY